MNKTVFISSTYDDLKPHRSKLWDVLQNYDINIRGMERFGARTEKSLETCITECELSDIYIGILGMRYGSIDEPSGKSYTYLEYEAAHRKDKEILFFLIDEDDAKIPPGFVDKGNRGERLDEFKKLARERHTVAYFVDKDDLSEKVKISLDHLTERKPDVSECEEQDKTEQSLKTIKDFLLMPRVYSGELVNLNVEIKDDPFPASKAICSNFNLEYGETVGVSIEVLKPKIDRFTKYLFIEHSKYSKIDITKGNKINISAVLKFTDDVIDTFRARFIREEYYRCSVSSSGGLLNYVNNPLMYIPNAEKVIYEPEGTIIVLFNDILK